MVQAVYEKTEEEVVLEVVAAGEEVAQRRDQCERDGKVERVPGALARPRGHVE
jgi:hypothetical protein